MPSKLGGPPLPRAVVRVCDAAYEAGRAVLGAPVSGRIVQADPADIICRERGGELTLDVEAQASPRAWTQYDTTVVHLVQAFGTGSVHSAGHLPQNVSGVGQQAVWVPAQRELIATNGTQSVGGSYLTVTVSGPGASGRRGLRAARAVGRAVIAVAPRGPSPGPPPS